MTNNDGSFPVLGQLVRPPGTLCLHLLQLSMKMLQFCFAVKLRRCFVNGKTPPSFASAWRWDVSDRILIVRWTYPFTGCNLKPGVLYVLTCRYHWTLWAPGGRKNTHMVSLSLCCRCMTRTKQLSWSVQTKPGHWHVSSLAPAVVTYLHLCLSFSADISLFLHFLCCTYSVSDNPDCCSVQRGLNGPAAETLMAAR